MAKRRPARAWRTPAVSAALGVVVGATAARSNAIWSWATSANYADVPGVAVGTAIPAVAGYGLARFLSRDAARQIRRDQLEVDAQFAARERRAAGEAVSGRKAAWGDLFDALPERWAVGSGTAQRQIIEQLKGIAPELAIEGAADLPTLASRISEEQAKAADLRAVRQTVGAARIAVQALQQLEVHRLAPVADCLALICNWAEAMPDYESDLVTLLTTLGPHPGPRAALGTNGAILFRSTGNLVRLRALAARERAGDGAPEFDPIVETWGGASSVPLAFADLASAMRTGHVRLD